MTPHTDYIFETKIAVRDYELDAEGIVNNANYLHYLELTRHEFCTQVGMSFTRMRELGIAPVARRIEIDYLSSLGPDEVMTSRLNLERRGPRFLFTQDIFAADGRHVVHALVTIVAVVNGRPSRGDELAAPFAEYLTN